MQILYQAIRYLTGLKAYVRPEGNPIPPGKKMEPENKRNFPINPLKIKAL